jgi:hypothetical protein
MRHTGTLELLGKGHIPASFWDWAYASLFTFGRDTEDEDAEAVGTASFPASSPPPPTAILGDGTRPKKKGKEEREPTGHARWERREAACGMTGVASAVL